MAKRREYLKLLSYRLEPNPPKPFLLPTEGGEVKRRVNLRLLAS
jgi:hypothetical protein